MIKNPMDNPGYLLEHLTWRKWVAGLCYGLIIVGALWRIDYVFHFNPIDHLWSDPARHWRHGINVLGSAPMYFVDPILFQLYISVLAKLTLEIPALVAFYTSALALIAPWMWYLFFRELQPSKLLALSGWAVLSLSPEWISIYGYFMQETLMLPLLGLALYLTWRCRRRPNLTSFLLVIFAWTLAGLTRGACIPMAGVAAIWLWFSQDDKIRRLAGALVVLALMLGPLAYRGLAKMNLLAPHGIAYLNLIYARSGKRAINIRFERKGEHWRYHFQSPAMMTEPLEPLSHWATRRKGTVSVAIDVDRGFADWGAALEQTSLDLSTYLWLTKENLVFLFFAPSWPDSNRATLVGNLNYHMRWIWLPLSVLCLFWVLFDWRRTDLLLPAIILAWFVFQGLVPIAISEGRYRKPLTGLLVAQAIALASHRRLRDAGRQGRTAE